MGAARDEKAHAASARETLTSVKKSEQKALEIRDNDSGENTAHSRVVLRVEGDEGRGAGRHPRRQPITCVQQLGGGTDAGRVVVDGGVGVPVGPQLGELGVAVDGNDGEGGDQPAEDVADGAVLGLWVFGGGGGSGRRGQREHKRGAEGWGWL